MMRIFLFAVCFLCLIVSKQLLAEETRKPHVLFIAIDDLNDWVGDFDGHAQAQTPNLDRFCKEGCIVFQNAHCPGPVCGPSRSALLSGFYPSRSGVYGNSQNMLESNLVKTYATLPEYFSKNGYTARSMGKIFHRHATENGADSGHWAFDEWFPTKGGGGADRKHITSRNRNLIDGKPAPDSEYTRRGGSEFAWGPTSGPKEEMKDYRTAQWAADQLKQGSEKPLFLAVGLSKPHLPFFVPQEFFDLYPSATTKSNPRREDDLADILTPSGKTKFGPTDDYLWLKQNGLVNEATRAYLAASSFADCCLGVIFDAIEESPMRDNLIVVVWGDHGWHLGEKLRYRKATGWREATRVPLMIRTPEMKSMRQCNGVVNLIDLYPTLIEYCGLPAKPELDGTSIMSLLRDPRTKWNQPTKTIFGDGNASIQDANWHFIRYKDGTEELYDLKQDPMEWENRIRSGGEEEVKAKERLASFYPTDFAKPVPQSDGSLKKAKKGLDKTIKSSRPLSALK